MSKTEKRSFERSETTNDKKTNNEETNGTRPLRHERYEKNKLYYRNLNLLNYYKKQLSREDLPEDRRTKYQAIYDNLTKEHEAIAFEATPRPTRREQTTAQLFPKYTSLMFRRLRLLQQINKLQQQNRDIGTQLAELQMVVDQLSQLEPNEKPNKKNNSKKAVENTQRIDELLKSVILNELNEQPNAEPTTDTNGRTNSPDSTTEQDANGEQKQ